MKIVPALALAAALLSFAGPGEAAGLRLAQAPYMPPPPSVAGSVAPGRPVLPESGPGTPTYESDGNSKNPAAVNSPNVPASQQGSGQETGGPARELIPRR